ncbi:Rieske 2Fe-2S domain-containing protein [Nocardia sp. NPDC050412]
MTPTAHATERSASAKARAPGALAPLVREAWYVLAARNEFDRSLKQRWILGEPVCFFEATDGQLVVLDDRCAHRRFPLSRSHLEGDVIRCGYHGFAYGPDGRCRSVPGADPGSISVRRYPTLQRGPWSVGLDLDRWRSRCGRPRPDPVARAGTRRRRLRHRVHPERGQLCDGSRESARSDAPGTPAWDR